MIARQQGNVRCVQSCQCPQTACTQLKLLI
jgi:hypothetical protein